GIAAFGGRSSNRNKDGFTGPRGGLQVAGKVDTPAVMPLQQLRQEAFMNRHLTCPQSLQLFLVVIDQHNFMTQIRETRARHQADVSRTHHGYPHMRALLLVFMCTSGSTACSY